MVDEFAGPCGVARFSVETVSASHAFFTSFGLGHLQVQD